MDDDVLFTKIRKKPLARTARPHGYLLFLHGTRFYRALFSSSPAVSAKIQYRIPTLCPYGLLVVLSEYASMPFIHPICSRNSHDALITMPAALKLLYRACTMSNGNVKNTACIRVHGKPTAGYNVFFIALLSKVHICILGKAAKSKIAVRVS